MAKEVITRTARSQPDKSQDHHNDRENDNKQHESFHPRHITLETFHNLLSHYPSTVERVHLNKLRLKLQSKAGKGPKRKAGTKVSIAPTTKTELDPSEEKRIIEEREKFLQLDRWRYEVLPKIIAERASEGGQKESAPEGAHLLKEELIDIMEWKTKHGVSRPMLMGMVKSNQVATITKSTSTAFATLPDADPVIAPNDAFPKASLDALTAPIRGVGPATASLILSIATVFGDAKKQVPFYSDDVYLWLCLTDFPEGIHCKEQKPSKHKKPNGELIVKYNMNEYRDLWNASQELRARLNNGAGERSVSFIDIERAAYVLRNIAVSDYYANQEPEAGLNIVKDIDSVNNQLPKESKIDSGELGTRRSKRIKQEAT
ncbi:hypothetical protein DTO006G1_6333 [Penicillium roqueforti]|uniref:uncharacterized protein n=1 Tax=Penicillium roqueforti TaxID=5082 RepID=UPI00190CF87D|nr:uncharacterized protein LCP9604111_4709 [Penicillium roqueforti]KAF9248993.1 hypothetical protein LCP9604111_4709 [Penicillium roqueforti]KAI2758936.1 hypothetical protein DTO006G1_6333 [Penicillium roqueforti]KAI3124296.1 hypothetical protein CBS147326_8126 [Penicillium roqueforti]KAI3199954.1 hypothetical protein CBS147311_5637 [Penicillium roqueforti]KAI3225201.1 hypothetical protein DTO012A7_7404 [Penicillium roqueforti]